MMRFYWLIRPPPACVKSTTSTSSLLANIALGGRIRKRTEPPIPATRTNRDGIRRGPAAFVAYRRQSPGPPLDLVNHRTARFAVNSLHLSQKDRSEERTIGKECVKT